MYLESDEQMALRLKINISFFLLAKKVEIYLAKKVDQTNKETLGMHFIILFKSWKKIELKKKKSWKDLKV